MKRFSIAGYHKSETADMGEINSYKFKVFITINEIKIVIGDEWYAGNLSYHLFSRPTWTNDLKNQTSSIREDQGVIYTGNPKVLKKICPGVYGTIKPVGYCMIGKRWKKYKILKIVDENESNKFLKFIRKKYP